MTRRAFYSFHFAADAWRASQVRNMGLVEGNQPVHDNTWEAVKRGGDRAIKAWIDSQLVGRSVTIVLIGSNTANRKWINYEIIESWNAGKGVLGVYIHNLLDQSQARSRKGANPFSHLTIGNGSADQIIKAFDPPYFVSTDVHNYIKVNLSAWIEDAIRIRNS